MLTLGIVNTIICCSCWGLTIRTILIRHFKNMRMIIHYNLLVFILMLINLIVILPGYSYLLRFVLRSGVIGNLIVLAAVVDFLSTLGLILFCIYSCYTRTKKEPWTIQNIIVLGAAINHGQVSPVLASRLNHAISCWQKYPSAKMIVSGGRAPHESLSEATAMADYLVAHGVPGSQIICECRAHNTRQNLMYAKKLVQSFASSTVVITSDFHVLRAQLDARRLGLRWYFLGTKTPWQFRSLTFIRDYLGVLRDQRWLAGCILVVTLATVELVLL